MLRNSNSSNCHLFRSLSPFAIFIVLGILFFEMACQTVRGPSSLNSARGVEKLPIKKGEESKNSLRPMRELTLKNGLRVIIIPDPSLPRVRLSLLVAVGDRDDRRTQLGINDFVAKMLSQGTRELTQSQFALATGEIAADLEIDSSADFTFLGMDSLTIHRQKLLSLFSDSVMRPGFRDVDIKQMRQRILAGLKQKKDDPGLVAKEEFRSLIYGTSSYGYPLGGTPSTILKIQKKDLLKHYLNYFRPNNSYLSISGDIDNDFIDEVEKTFAVWSERAIHRERFVAPTPNPGFQIHITDQRGLKQTQIVAGHLGIPRRHPDFLAARIASEILGGDFVSRLNQRLRVELGLTYGIDASFEVQAESGIFALASFTKNESVEKFIDEMQKVLIKFVESGVNEEELAAAKAQYVGHFPHLIETADAYTRTVLMLKYYQVPDNYLSTAIQQVKDLRVSDINRVIKDLIQPENLKISVYTDLKQLGIQLQKYQQKKGSTSQALSL